MKRLLILLFCTVSALAEIAAEIPLGKALPQAHAHNDYEHKRPLIDALSQGFTSVEADVYLVDGKLLVGHDREDLDTKRTLSDLYLDPLQKLASGKKSIFTTGETLTLLIDFKSEAESTYAALRKLLEQHREMLTSFASGEIHTDAVTVILSGNRPREALLSETHRFAAYDGRLADLGKNHDVAFMPLVSDNWNAHFNWKGAGEFPASEREKLRSIVRQAHAENRRIRFWATPDTEAAWKELQSAGVDLINTDNLSGLATFLRN